MVSSYHMTAKKEFKAIAATIVQRASQSNVMISMAIRNRAARLSTVKERWNNTIALEAFIALVVFFNMINAWGLKEIL